MRLITVLPTSLTTLHQGCIVFYSISKHLDNPALVANGRRTGGPSASPCQGNHGWTFTPLRILVTTSFARGIPLLRLKTQPVLTSLSSVSRLAIFVAAKSFAAMAPGLRAVGVSEPNPSRARTRVTTPTSSSPRAEGDVHVPPEFWAANPRPLPPALLLLALWLWKPPPNHRQAGRDRVPDPGTRLSPSPVRPALRMPSVPIISIVQSRLPPICRAP